MNSGLSARHLQTLEEVFARVRADTQSLIIWLYGSRATGRFRAYSDVDLLVDATPPLTRGQLAAIHAALEESLLPFRVDLVAREDLYPPYLPNIEQQKRLLMRLTPTGG